MYTITEAIVALLGICLWFILNELNVLLAPQFNLLKFWQKEGNVLLLSYSIALLVLAIIHLSPTSAAVLSSLMAAFGVSFTDPDHTGNALTPLLMGYMIISFVYKTKRQKK
jgi:hypothetical protein